MGKKINCDSTPWGIKSKDLEIGKEMKGQKNQTKKNIEDITLLAALKCSIKSQQHYLILFKPKYYYIGGIWGRKSSVLRPRGEENQRTRGRGKEIKGRATIYTPAYE